MKSTDNASIDNSRCITIRRTVTKLNNSKNVDAWEMHDENLC